MLIKKRTLIFGFVSVTVLLLVFVVAPWGIGQFLHSALSKHAEVININYPGWEYTIQKYQRGIFESNMVATLTLKNPLNPKTPIFKVLVEDEITHGPIFLDFQKKDIQFYLAKLTSQIKPEKGSIVQFDQDTFPVSSIVKYNGKIESALFFDRISGATNLGNRSLEFDFNNILSNSSLDLNSVYPSYHLSVKEAILSKNNIKLACKIKNVSINNISKSNQDLSGSNSLTFDLLEATLFDKKYMLEGYELTTETDVISNKYYFENRQQLKKFELDNIIYGPFQVNLIINKLPIQLIKDIQEIEVSSLHKDEKYQKISNLMLNNELELEFILKKLTLQMPGGELSLNGSGNFISKANQNKMDYGNSDGKCILNISKQALHRMLHSFVKSGEDIVPLVNMMLSAGYFIDTGKDYESYFTYKNNKAYVNGSALTDNLSKDYPKNLMRPFTATQELSIAIWADDFEKVKTLLLNKDVDVNFINTDMKNPIHVAALIGNCDIVRLLLENKVPVDQSDYQGNTPLYWAARNGHFDVVQVLLKEGASSNVQNMQGWSPLQEAAENGHIKIVEILLQQKKIEVNQADKEGRTALFWAAKNGQNEIIQLLLNKGADPAIENIRGLKPIDIARQQNHIETVNLLKN